MSTIQQENNQEQSESTVNSTAGYSKTNSVLRTIFGLFMIVIYVGMGVLLLINFFDWAGDWAWTRYGVGVLLIIYGFWRAYRQYKGIDSQI